MPKKPDVNAALLKSLQPQKTAVESVPSPLPSKEPERGGEQLLKKQEAPKTVRTEPSKPTQKRAAPKRGTVLRQNVTLFERDVEIIDRITDSLAKHGVRRVALSACIRIALRLSSSDPSMILRTYEEIRDEDGRTRA